MVVLEPSLLNLRAVPAECFTGVLHSMEEGAGEAPWDDIVDLVGLLNSVNVDISWVFGQ